MSGALVTAIIPTRNRRAFLQESVKSVIEQTYKDWELVVVDDCSEDDTWPWLRSLGDARVRAVRLDEHAERSAARNRGLREARGELVLFLDDDDMLLPCALETLVSALMGRPQAVAAVGAFRYFGGPAAWRSSHPRVPCERGVWRDVLFGWCPAQGTALIRRKTLEVVGGYATGVSRAEDHHLWLRLAREGPVALVAEVVAWVRVHPGQTPRESHGLADELRLVQVSGLNGPERPRAERLLRAREHWMEAGKALARDEYNAALAGLLRAALAAPSVLASPLLRPLIVRPAMRAILGCAAGELGVGFARRVRRRAARLFGG